MTQPVYNVYKGQGVCIPMTYRVIPGARVSQFYTESGWVISQVTEHTLRTNFPLVAKNVRFKT